MLSAIMVADKVKVNKEMPDYSCGNHSKHSSNLDSSQTSSDDGSLKSKSDHEAQRGRSINEDSKNESDEESAAARKNLNSTYLCRKPDVSDDFHDNENIENDGKSAMEITDLENNSQNSSVANIAWNYSSLLSLTDKFEAIHWNSELSDLKLEDSRLYDEKSEGYGFLVRIRNYLADYQELRGTPRGEYTFSTLIRFMGQATGSCMLALFHAVINIAPVFEVFLHIARFIVDKVIDIKTTTDIQQLIVKVAIFSVQVLCIYICLVFIFGFIVSPVVRMAFGILTKIMLYN